jgi:hypothetical protein
MGYHVLTGYTPIASFFPSGLKSQKNKGVEVNI